MFIDKLIGKYRVTRLIGEGGMATVYEAVHETLNSKVAIKILRPEFTANAKVRERFKSEAVRTASLKHKGIIDVKDFEEHPDYLALVLEFLDGEDLADRIKNKGPLSDSEVQSVFTQILDALLFAHEKGIAHRDIKPSNIFILPDGRVKILDFGIAKIFGEGNEMTQTGTLMGTPIYMSPEQVKGEKSIDHRTDIYSLGVTLYYALTGKSPYDAYSESWFLIPGKIVTEPLPEINSKYWPMICKACEKDRNKRYQECKEWLIELQRNNNERTTLDETIIFGGNTTSGERIDNTVEVTTDETKIKEQPHLKTARDPWKWIIVITGLIILIIIFFLIAFRTVSGEVRIGTQVWMTKNLDVTHFRNGDPIPQARTAQEWDRTGEQGQPAWCYCNNDPANGAKYGKLYNWYAVNDSRGLAPVGYHIPSDEEWTALTEFLGGKEAAGLKMKSTSGWSNNGNGNNEFGFSAQPGGYRTWYGRFFGLKERAYWWTNSFEDRVGNYNDLKGNGKSVRCVKD